MITKLVVALTAVLLIAYDVVCGPWFNNPTESMVLRDWSKDWTILPFIAGFLLSHWFLPLKSINSSAWGFALPIFAVLFIIDLIIHFGYPGQVFWWRYPFIYCILGIVAGGLLWPQRADWSVL